MSTIRGYILLNSNGADEVDGSRDKGNYHMCHDWLEWKKEVRSDAKRLYYWWLTEYLNTVDNIIQLAQETLENEYCQSG